MNDVTALTLREAAAAISQGRLRSEALVEACLERIERLQPALNCFIRVAAARRLGERLALADQAVKAGRPLGPLHGVPLAHKDMFYRAGEVCTVRLEKSAPTLFPITPRPFSASSTPLAASS